MNTEINIRKDGDIDVKELFSLIWQTKKIFTAMMILFGVISIIYSLSLPNLYTSESLVTVSSRDQGSSSGSEALLRFRREETENSNL